MSGVHPGRTPPSAEQRELDFVARLAAAWDGVGRVTFSIADQRALCALSHLPIELASRGWRELSGEQRLKILEACRSSAVLAMACAWVLGRE